MATNNEIEKLERRWLENPLGLTFAPLAEAYRKAGESAKALETLEVGLSQHPNYVPAHIVRGRCHLDAGDLAQAEVAFSRVLELDPENPIALKGLADLAESEGRLPEALGRLEALLEVDRNNEEARGQLEHVRELLSEPEPTHAGAEEPTDLKPESEASEFRLHDDARDLLPGKAPYPDILRSEVADELLPAAEAAQGSDMMDGPDPESAERHTGEFLSVSDSVTDSETPVLAEDELFTEPEQQPEPIPEPVAMEPEPMLELEDIPEVPAEPEAIAPSEVIVESEPVPEPEPFIEPEPEPELVVTETMAEIFLRQGHRELALAVYSQLSHRDPMNERLATAAAKLQAELAPPPPPPAPAPFEAPRQYAAADTGGRSVGQLFEKLLSAQRPAVSSAIHPPTFEAPRRQSGEPTRAAADALSLGAVFGEEAAPPSPAGSPPASSPSEPSFEQFFAPADGASADAELPKPPGNPAVMSSRSPEDLEQFNAWLRGLKR